MITRKFTKVRTCDENKHTVLNKPQNKRLFVKLKISFHAV